MKAEGVSSRVAIYHCSVKIISRSSGRSSVASAAYRAGEKLYNEYDGCTHDYSKRNDIVHTEIILPDNAPEKFKDRETLWNEVEKTEKRIDSQTAREVEIALPIELNREEQIALVREYVTENFVKQGMCVDFAIHTGSHEHTSQEEYKDTDQDIKSENPHAHIMLTMREVTKDGFTKKNREWNDKKLLVEWRKSWAEHCNREFEKKKLDIKIDHRSYYEQGVDKVPTVHIGKYATKIEREGGKSEMGDINREIQEQNKRLELLKVELAKLEEEIKHHAAEYEEALKQEEARLAEEAKAEEERRAEETKKAEERRKAEEAKRAEQVKQQQQANQSQQQPQAIEQSNEYRQWQAGGEGKAPIYDINEQAKMRLAIAYGQDYQKSQEIKENTNAEIAAIKNRLKDLEQRKEEFEKLNKQIADKKQERKQLGLFSSKEKKRLDKEIKDLEKRLQAKIDSLQKDRGLKPDEIDKAIADNKTSLDKARTLHKQAERQGKSLSDLMRDAKLKAQLQERTQNRNHDNKGRER